MRIIGLNVFSRAAVIRLRRAAIARLRRARGYGGQVASGYGIRKDPERCFQCAGCAKAFRRIGKDFRAALSADSDYRDHSRSWFEQSPFVLRKIF